MNEVVIGNLVNLLSSCTFHIQCTEKNCLKIIKKTNLKLERNDEFHFLRSLQDCGAGWLHLCGVSLLTVLIILSPGSANE